MNYEFPPVGGGAANASLATARELVTLGHSVDFLTTATPGAAEDAEIEGVRVYRVRSHRRGVHEVGLPGALSFVFAAAARLPAIARRVSYDVYHYYFSLPTGVLSLLPGRHQRRPYVISLRGSDVPGYDPKLARYHSAMLPITRRIWRGAHRVVANSHALRILALGSAPDMTIDVILNGADLSPRNGTRGGGSGLRVLAVSRLIARKGLDVLINAIGRLRAEPLSLDIAGDGPERKLLEQLARSCGVADRVRFHGFMDRPALASLYEQADIFVLASLTESCSMALLEAMGWGLPIIATRVGGTSELIDHGSNGLLIRAGDVDELTTAVRELAHDAARRERFTVANRALARDRFSWRSVAEAYQGIFQDAVERWQPESRRHGPAASKTRLSPGPWKR
ncbi:MAG: glycosyltransferase family 4 protein [Deltaproteobacteria bacterium]